MKIVNALDNGDIIRYINPNTTYIAKIIKPGKYEDEIVELIDTKTGEKIIVENPWGIRKFWQIVKTEGKITGEQMYDIWFPKGWLGI